MKSFDLNAMGVQEMDAQEVKETDGGFIEFLYELITGRSLASDARHACRQAAGAYAQTIQEGGKTCTDMPFK